MSDYTRSTEADELRDQLNNRLEYIDVLEAKCKDLAEELRIANLAVEHSRKVADEEALKKELSYRDGTIAGLKYAIRWMSDEEKLKSMQTMETEPVRHGRWIKIHSQGIYECSECHQTLMPSDIECYRFCPQCGARMDEDV